MVIKARDVYNSMWFFFLKVMSLATSIMITQIVNLVKLSSLLNVWPARGLWWNQTIIRVFHLRFCYVQRPTLDFLFHHSKFSFIINSYPIYSTISPLWQKFLIIFYIENVVNRVSPYFLNLWSFIGKFNHILWFHQ